MMAADRADKELHSQYKLFEQRVKRNAQNLTDGEAIKATLEEQNALLSRVTKPREQAVDAQLFAVVAEKGVELVKRTVKGGKSYTPADLVRRLKAAYVHDLDAQAVGASDPSAFDWAAVGFTVARHFRPAPVVHHMLGPMGAQPKARKVAQRAKRRAPLGEAEHPEELGDLGETDKQETDRNMEEMWGVLREQEGERAVLLELVINHRSFAQTVENLFTLSFLVRDRKVSLHDSEQGTVVALNQEDRKKKKKDTNPQAPPAAAVDEERVQFIIRLDMAQWELWRSVVDAGATLMPDRADVHPQQAQQPQLQQRQQQPQEEEEEEEEEGAAGPSSGRGRGGKQPKQEPKRQPKALPQKRQQAQQPQKQQQQAEEAEVIELLDSSQEEDVEGKGPLGKRSRRG